MKRAARWRFLLAGCLGAQAWACSGAPETPTVVPQAARPPASSVANTVPDTPAGDEPKGCADAGCWRALGQKQRELGILDAAAMGFERAYQLAPTEALLMEWADCLEEGANFRKAANILKDAGDKAEKRGDLEAKKRAEQRRGKLPSPPAEVSLFPKPAVPGVREAYEMMLSGRSANVADTLEKAAIEANPSTLAQLAPLYAEQGDWVRARKTWARARGILSDQGASIRLIPVETWHTAKGLWYGDKVALLRHLSPIDEPWTSMGRLEFWSVGTAPRPLLHWNQPQGFSLAALSDDGKQIVLESGGRLVICDSLTGAPMREIPASESKNGRIHTLLVQGSGDAMQLLASGERVTRWWNARGEVLGTFELEGTTPTITRAYTGKGTHHHNILRDSPTWPVSLALSGDLGAVAIGGSDSKIRLFRPGQAKPVRVLEFKWPYEERRPMGGNPDLNLPRGMRFSADGKRLLAVYTHGELLSWDTRTGKKLQAMEGACNSDDASKYVNRYTPPGEPLQAVTDEERGRCGYNEQAQIAPDLSLVVTSLHITGATRIRRSDSGATEGFFVDSELPSQYLFFSPQGALGMVDLYGSMALWSPKDKQIRRLTPPSPSGPMDPVVLGNGRLLQFESGRREFLWDLKKRVSLLPSLPKGAELLAVSPDGAFAAIRAERGAVDILALESGKNLFRYAVPSNQAVYASASKVSLLLTVQDYPKQNLVLCTIAKASCEALGAIDINGRAARISEDGRLIAGFGGETGISVWKTGSNTRILNDTERVHSMGFSKDGSVVAWIAHPDREKRDIMVHIRRVGEAWKRSYPLEGWPSDVAVSADGSEVVALMESGTAWRWQAAGDQSSVLKDTAFIRARRVRFSDTGKTLFFEGFNQIAFRRNDAVFSEILTLYPLLSGGWLAKSHAGAVDGSSDAAKSLAVQVSLGNEKAVFDGEFAWDAAHVDGVVERALKGEDVAPLLIPDIQKSAVSL